ncbi:hypothetical protein [Halocatena halophila]|uniref:hypothetical protein n=1 Tax=Halocatena halophila TaxID=2814576 RepID=UPI002ED5E2C9
MSRARSQSRRFAIVLVVCAIVVLFTGTGAFDSLSQQREVSVSVSEDSAFLAFEGAEPTVSKTGVEYAGRQPALVGAFRTSGGNTTTVTLGTITNGLSSTLSSFDLSVSVPDSSAITVRDPTVTEPVVKADRSSQLVATVECPDTAPADTTVTIEITAEGSDTSVSTSAQATIHCAGEAGANGSESNGAISLRQR